MTRFLVLAALVACGGKSTPNAAPDAAKELAEEAAPWTVITKPWTGEFGGVPPLDKVEIDYFKPAIRAGMKAHLAEIEAIAMNPDPASIDNTLVPLERAGAMLSRAMTVYGVWNSTMSSDEVREVQAAISPELSAHYNTIWQDPKLYARVKALKDVELSGPETRLIDGMLHTFVTSGVALDPEPRAKVAALDQELSALYNTFGNNVLADEEGYRTKLGKDDIEGLPAAWLEGAADPEAADTWWVRNTRSSVDPFLTYSANRPMREKVWRTFYNRGDNGDEHDNNATVAKILELRAEKARMLGYDNFAHMRLSDKMAQKPEAAIALLERVWKPAVKKFKDEVKAMQGLADSNGDNVTIAAWDVKYYGIQVRERDFKLDANELAPYLQMEKLREAMFWAAGELYGFGFEPVTNVPVQHADVRVWKVVNPDGSTRGLWYFDPYGKEGKRSGAWMNAYRIQNHLDGDLPIVTNQSNFVKGNGDSPVTISWDDAETLFHEFGHALHGLSSDVHYPTLAGTNTLRDFTEFPSQLNEAWLGTPQLLEKFALHVETGEPMPMELIQRVKAAANADSGFRTTELLASALVDMKLHMTDGKAIDPDAWEKEAMAAMGTPDEIVMRHRTPQFGHVFAGEGYSAGYYSYVWADVLTADAAEAFEEAGSFYDPTVAKSYHDNILSVGNTIDPAEAFRAFRGREPDVDALLRKRGFPVE